MSGYVSAKNGWSDPRSSFEKTVTPEGRLRFEGTYCLNGTKMRFCLNGQTKGEYLLRGTLSIISRADGMILQATGENKQNVLRRMSKRDPGFHYGGGRMEKLNASVSLHSHSADEDEIKKYIAACAERLYAKHCGAISDDLMKAGNASDMTILDLWVNLKNEYLTRTFNGRSDKYIKGIENDISAHAAALSGCPAEKVTDAMLKRYAREHGLSDSPARIINDFKNLRQFLDYCLRRKLVLKNPLRVYLDKLGKGGKDYHGALRSNRAPVCVSTEDERRLNAEIGRNIQDEFFTGLLLIKETGMSPKDAASLKWADVEFIEAYGGERYCLIKRRNEKNAGATHDYSCPVSPLAGKLLSAKRDELLKTAGIKQIGDRYVCSGQTRATDAKELTAFCRQTLRRLGVTTEDSEILGVRLLQSNFRHRLAHYCGLGDGSGVMEFLLGRTLSGKVTADHYRSFTCPEGQLWLYHALQRDTRFMEPTHDGVEAQVIAKTDGVTKALIPGAPGKRAGAKVSVTLLPGQYVDISVPKGASLSWEALR